MRIAQVTPVYPPYRGGMGTIAAEYTRLLTEVGEEVTVFSPSHIRPFFSYGNGAILLPLLWKLRGYDVIHLHYPFFGSDLLVALAARFWRIPLTVTFHMRPKASGWLGLLFRVYTFCFEWIVLGAARTILVSSKDYAESVSLTSTRMREMPFGINTDRFSPGDGSLWRLARGIGRDEIVVLFVGGLDRAHYFKGVEILLESVRTIDVRVVIVGSGSEKARYEAQAKALGVAERVIFAGSVPFEQLPDVYRAADIHVLPSIDRSEAWGLVTIEAAASGIPSIVSNLPGVRTVIIPGETGLLVFPGDVDSLREAIQKLVHDVPLRKQMGQRARQRAQERYDDRHLLQRLREIYRTGKLPSV